VVVPANWLNYYPWKQPNNDNNGYRNIVSFMGDHYGEIKTTPMPSVNKELVENISKRAITIEYVIKNKSTNEDETKYIDIDVYYEKRACHHNYKGNVDDKKLNYNSMGEYPGKTSKWSDLQPLNGSEFVFIKGTNGLE
jgi:hypothetical protein